MTPEDRARAVVTYFPAIPPSIRAQLETAITSAIKRALNQQLAELELAARKLENFYAGRGKSMRNYDEAAMKANAYWANRLRNRRLISSSEQSKQAKISQSRT